MFTVHGKPSFDEYPFLTVIVEQTTEKYTLPRNIHYIENYPWRKYENNVDILPLLSRILRMHIAGLCKHSLGMNSLSIRPS